MMLGWGGQSQSISLLSQNSSCFRFVNSFLVYMTSKKEDKASTKVMHIDWVGDFGFASGILGRFTFLQTVETPIQQRKRSEKLFLKISTRKPGQSNGRLVF